MVEPLTKQLCAKSIGDYVIDHLNLLDDQQIASMSERSAISLLCQIKEILDDDTLDDPTCFQRMDAIVTAFQDAGLSTRRHWACE